ncbi:CDC27 family protein [Hydromonas duriensis]|uniref:Anaphase-promoting complex subunit 3 n=1 Tax=Hydromonas duriensis TaxID=1527608 RepID=A0A4R6Y7Z0_9BURK|nr:CDC27 family protein [Hydromonas duriensis]TDR31486.1 anaphase-promoting complex subunit 3 [Hydromonas duriensis]
MNPTHLQSLLDTAQQLDAQGQKASARALWHAALRLNNELPLVHAQLAYSYGESLNNDIALTHAQMWYHLDPTNPSARWLYGLFLFRMAQHQHAIDILVPLAETQPNWPNLHLVIAKCYLDLRQMEKGAPYFERAVQNTENDPIENAKVRWEYAMQLLTQGHFKEGWHNHEARLISIGWANLHLCPLPAPLWKGEPLKNKTIVVHGEQGLGDEIMYASMLPDLIAQGAHIILACYIANQKLMQDSFPEIQIVNHPRGVKNIQDWQNGIMPDWWNALIKKGTHIDYQIPMGSLANILRPDESKFPRTPYLKINQTHAKKMQRQLTQRAKEQHIDLSHKHLIALAWCGNLDNPHGRAKSLTLEQLAGLGRIAQTHNAVFVSLQNQQYGKQAIDAHAQGIMPIVDMSPYTDSFVDTLALASLCEQIITIDTSYVHLCSAAGLPATMLLRRNCDWRWGWTRHDSVWYKELELIRQEIDGDWTPVIKKTEEKLLNWLTS